MTKKKQTGAGKALARTGSTAIQPARDTMHRMEGGGDLVDVDVLLEPIGDDADDPLWSTSVADGLFLGISGLTGGGVVQPAVHADQEVLDRADASTEQRMAGRHGHVAAQVLLRR